MERETLRCETIPSAQDGEPDFVVTLWSEGRTLGLDVDLFEDEPMESLARGWAVPFWVHEDRVALLIGVEL